MSRRRVAAAATAAGVLVAGVAGTVTPASAVTPATVTFAFAGDTILGNTPKVPADPARYLAPVVTTLSRDSDVVFGNLEGTLTSSGTSKCTSGAKDCYAFRNPPSFARAYAGAGFDVMGLANNHSNDYGTAGRHSTEPASCNADVRYAGLPGQITYLTRNHVRVAFVAFAPYGNTNNLLDLRTAARMVRTAHQHAAVVVVYMHAGAEGATADHVTGGEEHYVGEDRGNPQRFAHLAVDNGASLVVASGPHVLRGMEFYKKRLIAYSLGDFANYENFSSGGTLRRSLVLHVTLGDHGGFMDASLTSITLSRGGRAQPGGDSIPFVASLSKQDFGAHAPVIGKDGRMRPR